ncbi:MAG: stage II sporulation protein M [Gammaproteobacteria bacterium]|nr:stage II sporulation protein M [Gammaproteobacteria bacterium]
MKENRFIHNREEIWRSYENALDQYERTRKLQTSTSVEEFVDLYRAVSHDLTVARTRHYGANLITRLNTLVLRGHNLVYFSRTGWLENIFRFYTNTFPREVRKHKKWVLTSLFLFTLPWLAVSYCISQSDTFIYTVMDRSTVASFEQMYDPNSPLREIVREEPLTRIQAFGRYIQNNTSIGLVVFVSGIGFGLLTIFVLLVNSVFLGSVFAHLTVIGFGSTLYPFTIGHGALELTAIVIAGAAGLRLAGALYFPGTLGRQTALRQGIREAMTLAAGFFTMFILAAFIEAFWSPLSLPPPIVKYVVGGILWILVISYFLFAGRNEISRLAG